MVAPSRAEAPAAPSPPAPVAASRAAVVVPAGVWLTALMVLAAALRVRLLGAGYWSDEALTVGIARHPLAQIPSLLRHDGSPPLYYLLLHVWMAAFGASPVATHALSLLLCVICVAAAWWVTGAVFGSAPAFAAAALAASLPYFTVYGTQTRMYALLGLLALLAVGCFLRALQTGDRRWMAGAVAASAGALYTNNWALYLVAALFVVGAVWALAGGGRALWLVVAYGGAAGLAYLPWLPTLSYQVSHTGAPWAAFPGVHELWFDPLHAAAGRAWPLLALFLVGVVAAGAPP
ncbi:MAG: glycosyltransferase family 39 protein, partial [Acidimicrobiales bacterium]